MDLLISLLIIFTAGASVANPAEQKDSELPCLLPPYPEHGAYKASPEAVPGDRLEAVVLNVTCNDGYNLVGESRMSCLSGWWSSDMPECLPFCKPGNSSGVVMCGGNVSKCVITVANLPSLGSRTTSSDYNCGYVGPESERIISGGLRADFFDAPWHAGLYTKTTSPYMQICGGTLIARDVVVTAAHCFSQDGSVGPVSNYAIAVGKIYRPWNNDHDNGAQKSDVKEIRIPPLYMGSLGNFQDDIALVIVTKEFYYSDSVRPACVSFDPKFDEEQLSDGNYGKVFGWGLVGENSKSSQVLRYADLPYVNIRQCVRDSPLSFKSSITSDKFCAGYTNGTAVCRGDSGGGLTFPKVVAGKERYFLRGVVSTSPSSENACNIHTWATFTHILRHEAFLKTVIDSAEVVSTVPVNQPASSFKDYPVYNLDFRMQTKKPTYDDWI